MSPASRASSSGTSRTRRSSAVENTLPCASVLSESVPPPSSAPCSRKLSAPRFGSSKRSTSPVMSPSKCSRDALAREISLEHRVPLGFERDQADVGRVALVARAGVRDVEKSHLHESTSTFVRTTGLVDQRRPVGDDLLDLRPSAGEAGHARRAVEHERHDLARESLDRRLVFATNADAELHLRRVVRVAGETAVRRRRADEFREDRIESEAETVESLAQHAVGELRLRERVRPRRTRACRRP